MSGADASASRADELVAAITHALHDGEIKAIYPLLRLLALEDPKAAWMVLDTIKVGLALRAVPSIPRETQL